ncbi:MAG TPA: YcnI family protein, partial [Sporichthyaceae bacterium]|nr:YcnI family protein [Sporichthyaceae bacterium]
GTAARGDSVKRTTACSGLVAGLALVMLSAPLAGAHVTVSSDSTAKGSGTTLTFRVPTERDDASTTKLEVDFPSDQPLTGSVLSKPGWSFEITKAAAATPTPNPSSMPGMNMADDDAPAAITSIVWTANDTSSAIKPGGYDLFTVRVPKLPDTDALTFKALQTYSDDQVVRWIDVAAAGTAQPDHPAPTLHLTAASDAKPPAMSMPAGGMTMTSTPMAGGMQMEMGPSRDDTVNVALGLGIAGLFLGLVAGTLGGAALARSRGKSER